MSHRFNSLVSAMFLLTLFSIAIFLLFILFSIFILKLYTGKSLKSSLYAPVKGTVFHQLMYFNTLYDQLSSIALEHPTFRLLTPSNSELYTVDPRNVEHMLKTRFNYYSKGERNHDMVRDLFGDGIFTVDGDKWRQQRKLASFEFSTRVLRDFSSAVFRKNAAKLVRIISEYACQRRSFDIQDVLMKSSLDSILKVGFGVELDCLGGSTNDGSSFITAFDEANALVYWRFVDVLWPIKRFLNIGSEAKLRNNVQFIDDFVFGLIRARREKISQGHCNDKQDILSRFLVESEKDPNEMNDKYLRDIILNFIIAGKDSSANTLSWFLYMLCKHPLIQEKISQQVQQVIVHDEEKDSVSDFAEKITESILDKMHYLHAALTETLRLYPAVPIDGKCSDADDILPDGFRLKRGDGLYYLAYSMGRTTEIWGEDAEKFRPERWLDDGGVFRPESPFKFIAFHAGPRICLGKDFAYRQMKIVAMALLRFFRFHLEDAKRQVTYKTMFTLHIDGGLKVVALPKLGLTKTTAF